MRRFPGDDSHRFVIRSPKNVPRASQERLRTISVYGKYFREQKRKR
jgi:hypothetical protein